MIRIVNQRTLAALRNRVHQLEADAKFRAMLLQEARDEIFYLRRRLTNGLQRPKKEKRHAVDKAGPTA